MPSISSKQRRFMGADLARAEAGEKTKTGMSADQLRDFASKPIQNAAGGAEPGSDALRSADFITLPEGVLGTNCGNCQFNKGGVCRNENLDGLPVTERQCCIYWDAPGTVHEGQEDAGEPVISMQECLESICYQWGI